MVVCIYICFTTILNLAEINLFLEICVLHLWIHAVTWLLKIATHLRVGHLKYTETADIKADCDKALKEIQQVCKNGLSLQPFNLIFFRPGPWRQGQHEQGGVGGGGLGFP